MPSPRWWRLSRPVSHLPREREREREVRRLTRHARIGLALPPGIRGLGVPPLDDEDLPVLYPRLAYRLLFPLCEGPFLDAFRRKTELDDAAFLGDPGGLGRQPHQVLEGRIAAKRNLKGVGGSLTAQAPQPKLPPVHHIAAHCRERLRWPPHCDAWIVLHGLLFREFWECLSLSLSWLNKSDLLQPFSPQKVTQWMRVWSQEAKSPR